jgi:hypothetical protein
MPGTIFSEASNAKNPKRNTIAQVEKFISGAGPLRALKQSPLALDLYVWAGHKAYSAAMGGNRNSLTFWHQDVTAVYPEAGTFERNRPIPGIRRSALCTTRAFLKTLP